VAEVRASVLVVMGVSGVGKSTVAEALAERLGWPLQEGDELHPSANVEKMAAGTPLDDADRTPWLERVAGWIEERLDSGESGIVTCSALARRYRDVLRRPGVLFVYLEAPRELIAERLAKRQGHYMPASLLDSQLQTLEPPQRDERSILIRSESSPAQAVQDVVREAGLEPRGLASSS
jgi:gluconokinase